MEEVLQKDLDGFERVWQRVVGDAPAQCTPEETLRALMDGERSSHMFYAALAKCCGTQFRNIIMKIATDEARHLRELQLEYFLLSGNSYTPTDSCTRQTGALNALRTAYLAEKSSSANYLAAAERESGDRSALYRRIAGEELSHAEELRRIIEKSMKYN